MTRTGALRYFAKSHLHVGFERTVALDRHCPPVGCAPLPLMTPLRNTKNPPDRQVGF
jgi:hypothetical protein